jgi:hypothetical protein
MIRSTIRVNRPAASAPANCWAITSSEAAV